MKLFRKRQKLGNRGLSMIELLCSLAIMSILGMVAGSMLIVSANSYQRENADTDAQKEAQLVANQISDLLIDTTAEVEATNGVVDGRNRTSLLTIIQGTAGYEVEFVATENKLYYRQFIVDAAGNKSNYTSKQLMAENLVNFYADVATFKETGNVKLDMVYAKGAGEYPAVFTVTARNKELMAGTAPAIFVSVPTEVILEPNQSYKINAPVSGAATGLTWSIADSVSDTRVEPYGTKIASDGTVHIGSEEDVNMFRVKVATTATDASGNPLVVKYVRVYVRKVTDVLVTGVCSGAPFKKDAVYTITPTIFGNNMEKGIGQSWDNDYVNPKATGENPIGVKWVVEPYGITASDYQFISDSTGARIILNSDMPDGAEIKVTAIARHPLGMDGAEKVNKTGESYSPGASGTWVLRKPQCAIDMGDGWKRRTNEHQGKFNDTVEAKIRHDYANNIKWKFSYKYREYPSGSFQDAWIPNVYGGNADNNKYINVRPVFTSIFDYDKDYEMMIKIEVFDANSGEKVFPQPTTPEDEYIIRNVVKKVSMTFRSDYLPGLENALMYDKESAIANPITLTKETDYYDFLVYQNIIGVEANSIFNEIVFILEKEVTPGNWVECPSSDAKVQNVGGHMLLNLKADNYKGLYRIKIKAVNQPTFKIVGTSLVSGDPIDYILYNEETGNNIYYFQVN